ncbi:hydroxymethylglutaryl-CoA lyase [Falsiroseomonas sp.]|uniref:hydroxymethylglutaryl-CoA lyase n=1 Tax=Falsiroseomonas sp. TaxID=2870721 RepID=UPI002718AD39|nr:hydroxymethylglutaryl-CoA lyase [Falsiroseomonas sp.]MDO9502322.1 hydroxymethylglutaryl-CoA lyase [Falsiroseomonas sp.]MDP3414485.1 hydroxymethylglutaryl-CoA lyase [Falsiroseomonas sp.]
MIEAVISEVAPRDGLQSIGPFVPTETKIELVRRLHAAGLRRMEIGSFVSPKAVPQMADTGAVLDAALALPGLECTVLAPNRRGFEMAKAAGAHRVGVFMSVTESHNKANVNRSRMDSFLDLSGIVADAVAAGMKVRFNLSCAFHCPFEGVVPEEDALDWVERVQALDQGIEISICDTTGNAAPDQVRRVLGQAIRSWPDADGRPRFAFHGHDTYGLGVANCAAAWEAGCRVFDSAAGGLGGCPFAPGATGNVATEDVAWLFQRMGVSTGVDWPALLAAADYAAAIPGALPGGRMRAVPAARLAA